MVTKNKLKGFTIVELLIVIVIIGILAAITVVSFTGITARANTASEQSAANAVISKALIYKAQTGQYPLRIGTIAGLTTTDPAYLTGVTSVYSTTATTSITAPASPYNSVLYRLCGLKNITTTPTAATAYSDFSASNAGTDVSLVATSLITGIVAQFWNFTGTPAADNTIYDGVVSGTAVYNGNSYTVGCVTQYL